MKAFIFFLFIIASLPVIAQSHRYQKLLDTAFTGIGLQIVHTNPLSRFDFDLPDGMKWYKGNYEYNTNKKLDTIMFAQIIKNAAHPDTASWKEEELNKFLIYAPNDGKVSKEYALRKLALSDTAKIKEMEHLINQYNGSDNYYRNLYHFSRPVFDDSGRFAIVQWDNGHAGRSGGGEMDLYELIGDSWIKMGNIMHWVH